MVKTRIKTTARNELELKIRAICYNEKEIKDLLWQRFGWWFSGQTGIIINGETLYFKTDVERYIKGLPNID
jgi:hypothetical protein